MELLFGILLPEEFNQLFPEPSIGSTNKDLSGLHFLMDIIIMRNGHTNNDKSIYKNRKGILNEEDECLSAVDNRSALWNKLIRYLSFGQLEFDNSPSYL